MSDTVVKNNKKVNTSPTSSDNIESGLKRK